MDYTSLALDAWRIARRGRPLWWLGLVSAASALVYELILMAVTLPLVTLPQLMLTPDLSATSAAAPLDIWRERAVLGFSTVVSSYGGWIMVGFSAVMVIWIVLGVLDVASQTGLISQVDEADRGGSVSFRTGMRDGFRVWWRVVGLLAIAALPALCSVVLMGIVMLFTITLPLLAGHLPDARAALAANAALAPVSTLLSLVAIPLTVTVQLGMRDAVLADMPWRPAFSAGWRMVRGNLVEVALVYLLLAAVGLGVGLVAGVVFAALAAVGVAGIVAAGVGGGAGVTGIIVVVAALVMLISLIALPVMVLLLVWNSAVWTLYWRQRAGATSLGATMAEGRQSVAN